MIMITFQSPQKLPFFTGTIFHHVKQFCVIIEAEKLFTYWRKSFTHYVELWLFQEKLPILYFLYSAPKPGIHSENSFYTLILLSH